MSEAVGRRTSSTSVPPRRCRRSGSRCGHRSGRSSRASRSLARATFLRSTASSRRAQRRELLSRQGNADDADRHAPDQRRREDPQRYQHHRAGRARHVEEREHQFLYQDGDGFHFMNMENYDQVAMQDDVIGDQAAYLHPEMKVMLSMHEGTAISIVLPQKVTLEVTETEPTTKGQTVVVLQARDAVERRAHQRAAVHRGGHARRGDDGGRLLRRAREGVSTCSARPASGTRFTNWMPARASASVRQNVAAQRPSHLHRLTPRRRSRSGSSRRCRRARNSPPGSWRDTAGDSPRRNRTAAASTISVVIAP